MPGARPDPFAVLGISANAPDAEIRRAYHRLVQRHHPDHNGGSPESVRRFEEVQEAYAEVMRSRRAGSPPPRAAPPPPAGASAPRAADPSVEARLAGIEREVREAHAARERAQRAAREAAAAAASSDGRRRPSDDELGYVHTDDSFSQILADARSELASRIGEGLDGAQTHPAARRVSDLIDELAARLRGEGRGGSGRDS
jgi:curved DNA-binding protein CbpA